jgi:hypothetical protein
MRRVCYDPDVTRSTDSPVEPTRAEVLREVDALVDACRVECLWYLRRDWYPGTDADRLRVLAEIQERAGREVFRRAGMLKAWLSRRSSDGSASS